MRVPRTNRHVRPLAKRCGNLRKTGVAVDDLSTEKVQLRARGHKQVEQIAITHGRIVARFPVQIIGAEDPVDLRASLGLDLKLLRDLRSEEHTSELQSLMRISYAVFCLKQKKKQ